MVDIRTSIGPATRWSSERSAVAIGSSARPAGQSKAPTRSPTNLTVTTTRRAVDVIHRPTKSIENRCYGENSLIESSPASRCVAASASRSAINLSGDLRLEVVAPHNVRDGRGQFTGSRDAPVYLAPREARRPVVPLSYA